ncbi:protein-tyrosine phosphatase-like protein [Kalaharituber pfeilii]|nr:protein-tyrosine phosphatase-like protein [Kalaharituber pfeilii]
MAMILHTILDLIVRGVTCLYRLLPPPPTFHTYQIYNLRGEDPGYRDAELYPVQVHHAPWPDHHAPPFELLLETIFHMHSFLTSPHIPDGAGKVEGNDNKTPILLVHCKAGKGRSGTLLSSYLTAFSHLHGTDRQPMTALQAMSVFTAARMRPGFGEGVSIASQRRYVRYVEKWFTQLQQGHQVPDAFPRVRVPVDSIRVTVVNPAAKGLKVKLAGYSPPRCGDGRAWCMAEPIELEPRGRGLGSADGMEAATVYTISGSRQHHSPRSYLLSSDICIMISRRALNGVVTLSKARAWFNPYLEEKEVDAGTDDEDDTRSRWRWRFEAGFEEMEGVKGTSWRGWKVCERVVVEGSMEIGGSDDEDQEDETIVVVEEGVKMD